MTGVSIEHLIWGGGWPFDGSELHQGTFVDGFSGRYYSGDWIAENATGVVVNNSLNSTRKCKYLYSGNYNNSYGIFYLFQYIENHYPDNTYSFYYMNYTQQEKVAIPSDKIIKISLPNECTLQEFMSHVTYGYIFDLLPESWKSNLLSRITPGVKYTLCFVAQSDIEEFLNTYWKYEGGN